MTFKHLQLLGWPCLVTPEGSTPLPASRPMQLLAYLAVAGAWQGRDALARLFWPGSAEKLARSNLRNLLFKTGAAAPWAPIETTEHALRLVVPTDLQAHAAAVQQADWEAVVRLGAEELLQGLEPQASEPWLRWLRVEREDLLAQWTKAVQALVAQPDRPVDQRDSLAAAWARRCPDDEQAVMARIALARERGQGAAAARIYREFEATLQQTLGVRPSRELQRIALQDPPDAAQPTAQEPPAVPAPATAAPGRPGLFGRRTELSQLAALLADSSVRLACLTGPGGVGKSTLLAALLAQVVDGCHGHARLIDVSAAPDAVAVVAAMGAAWGVDDLQGPEAVQTLAAAVRDMDCLLLLDGAEQAGLAGPIALLLEQCPRMRLVVASRSRLHLDPEVVVPLEGFPLPDAEETDADVLASNDAVRYFAAAMRQAGQAVDLARVAPAIARLARAVEGLPLALKLLARLTHLYTLPQLLDSVRLQLAGGVTADSPAIGELMPALVASFDRSWTALGPPQQAALARLAVFPAPFDVAAARAVGRTSLPVITSLVDASLLRADGAGLLSLHAAIRACVLQACPLSGAVEDDYRRHYGERLVALSGLARSRTVRPMRLFLVHNAAHVEAVWQLALQRRAYATLLSVAESLWFLADGITGPTDWQGGFVQADALLHDDAGAPAALRALLAAGAARAAHFQGHLDEAAQRARGAMRLARQARHHDALVFALDTLIRTCLVQRKAPEARALMSRLQALLDPDRDSGLLGAMVLRLRQMLLIVGTGSPPDPQISGRLEALYERFEDTDALVRVLLAKAYARASGGELDRGIDEMERTAELAAERDANPALRATALCEAAGWLLERGRIARARACVERANAIAYTRPQAQFLRLKTDVLNAALAIAGGDATTAAPRLAVVLAAMGRGEELPMVQDVFLVTARWFLLLRQRDAAVELLQAVDPQVWEMRTYGIAQDLLRELGEPPRPPGDVSVETAAPAVAQAARLRVLRWIEGTRDVHRPA